MTLHLEQLSGQQGHQEIVTRLSETILIHILRTYLTADDKHKPAAIACLTDKRLGKALQAMHQDPGFDWSLERLAEVASMSRSAFAERFREHFTVTPMRYLADWRMQKARLLLSDQQLNVSEVANAVGYASDAAFSGVFKKQFGIAPGAYRKQVLAA